MDSHPTNDHHHSSGMKNNAGMAILAYLGILIIIPFLTSAHNEPFVKFHIKQGLVLIISWVVSWMIGAVIHFIPLLGALVSLVLFLFNCIMVIIGIINAASGKEKELPVIGHFAKSFNF